MISSINMSNEAASLALAKNLSDKEISNFSTLLKKANDELDQNVSAREVLLGMSNDEMALLQKARGLADPINHNSISREGAINLLTHHDRNGTVDLNNDGFIEIGASKIATFPPVNAPNSVRVAWEKATEDMAFGDKMIMQLHMHEAVYGTHINGVPTREVRSQEDQWSPTGIKQLFEELNTKLDLAVSRNGWSNINLERKDFYKKFEKILNQKNNHFV